MATSTLMRTKLDVRQMMQALRNRRLALEMPAAELCTEADMHPSQLCRYEKGTSVPSMTMIERLARALGIKDLAELENYLDLDIDQLRDERKEKIWDVLEQIHVQRFRIGMPRAVFASRAKLNGLQYARYEIRQGDVPSLMLLRRMAEVVGLEIPENFLDLENHLDK